MERQRSKQVCLLMWVLVAALFSHNMVIAVTSTGLGEQKNYYPAPDPHAGTPPSGSHGTPPSSGGGSPPSHGTPSHGGGYHPSPTPSTPSGGNCGTPPHDPSTPSTPSHTPSHGTPPSSGGGSPPSYGGGSPPSYGGGIPHHMEVAVHQLLLLIQELQAFPHLHSFLLQLHQLVVHAISGGVTPH
uniref:Uncharacterized protein n=1 Tax=Gossypium raimondii TaxID=29730 RepID=A0A0D2TI88_GOSRA|nr:hypothetical protein B456_012G041900 [Gossypium raimondii]